MFIFLCLCFSALCLVFMWMNLYAARQRSKLLLSEAELFATRTAAITWAGSAMVGLLSVAAAMLLEPPFTPFAGFVYMLLGLWIWFYTRNRDRKKAKLTL